MAAPVDHCSSTQPGRMPEWLRLSHIPDRPTRRSTRDLLRQLVNAHGERVVRGLYNKHHYEVCLVIEELDSMQAKTPVVACSTEHCEIAPHASQELPVESSQPAPSPGSVSRKRPAVDELLRQLMDAKRKSVEYDRRFEAVVAPETAAVTVSAALPAAEKPSQEPAHTPEAVEAHSSEATAVSESESELESVPVPAEAESKPQSWTSRLLGSSAFAAGVCLAGAAGATVFFGQLDTATDFLNACVR